MKLKKMMKLINGNKEIKSNYYKLYFYSILTFINK